MCGNPESREKSPGQWHEPPQRMHFTTWPAARRVWTKPQGPLVHCQSQPWAASSSPQPVPLGPTSQTVPLLLMRHSRVSFQQWVPEIHDHWRPPTQRNEQHSWKSHLRDLEVGSAHLSPGGRMEREGQQTPWHTDKSIETEGALVGPGFGVREGSVPAGGPQFLIGGTGCSKLGEW